MTAISLPALFLCLLTGCALGMLFLVLKALRLAVGAGRWLTAGLDILFGALCGAVVFLTALAVDKGRLRLMQAAPQILGAWGAVAALDPLASRLGRGIRCACLWVRRLAHKAWRTALRPVVWLWGKRPRRRPKRGKKRRPVKKPQGRGPKRQGAKRSAGSGRA